VHVDDVDLYDCLYLPWPVMLKQQTADALKRWVERGGTLISEGCPGYFGDRGRAGATQPGFGLADLFGAQESYVEFAPDILGGLTFQADGLVVPGGVFLQAYVATSGGTATGWYEDGRVAAVDHAYGRGRTRLIGTYPGYGHYHRPSNDSRRFFRRLIEWAGRAQHATVSAPGVVARLHSGPAGTYLWVLNHNRAEVGVDVELSADWGPFERGEPVWSGYQPEVRGRRISIRVDGRDGAVLALR
jgi:beta-galactosidase